MSWENLTSEGPVDVTLVVEGTYPFVRGGVSAWVHRLIESLPETTFAVAFLGGRRADHGAPLYPALPNVRHFACGYLFEPQEIGNRARTRGGNRLAEVERLFEALETGGRLEPELLRGIALSLGERGGLTVDLLHSDEAWDRIREAHEEICPDGSFTDFFWTVRAMFTPIFAVAALARRLPPSRSYHAVSTGYAGLLGAILHHRNGRPLILTEHGIYTKERKIDLASAERVPGDGEDPTQQGFGRRMWTRFFEGLGRITYASADEIVALYGGSQQRQIHGGADPSRARIIPNGVDIARFRALRAKRPEQPPPVLGFFGRVVPIKDVKNFVRAMKGVTDRRPDAEGWIVGPTSEDEGYANECVQLAETLGLGQRLSFKGFRSADEILPRLGLLVLTSISEALPLVILEAFASGLPVVTTDVGSCRELIEGLTAEDRAIGPAGAVVPISDPEAIARAVLGLLSNPDRWHRAQEAAIRRVETFYAEGQVFSAYRHIYSEAHKWRA